MNQFLDELAKQQGYTIGPQSLSKLPTDGKKIRPKTQKAKDYEELIKYAEMGIYDEDNRPYDPMEIDLAVVNIANRIGGVPINSSTTVNATRPVTRKKKPVKKKIIRRVVKGNKKKRVNLIIYEEPDNDSGEEKIIEEIYKDEDKDDNIVYEEVEDDNSNRVVCNIVKKK